MCGVGVVSQTAKSTSADTVWDAIRTIPLVTSKLKMGKRKCLINRATGRAVKRGSKIFKRIMRNRRRMKNAFK